MQTSILLVSLGLLFNAHAFKYMGVNQAGPEFGSKIPGTYMVDYAFPKTSSIDYFVSNGMNIIRLPFLWERLQPQLNGAFDVNYLKNIDDTVKYVTQTKGVYIMLDVHNYLLYRDVAIGQGVSVSAFQSFWKQLAGLYKSNPKVIFGLMNEPHDVPFTTVYEAMQAGINGIRSTGAKNAITVPGNEWTGVHSWMNSAPYMSAITDPENNFMFEMHQYFDNNYSGNGKCVSTFNPEYIFGPATAWLRAAGKTGFLGEFGIENSPQCLAVLDKTMAYLKANADVWVGWTWWAAGPWWGSAYKFSLEQGVGDAQLAVLKKYIIDAAAPAPAPATPSTTGSVKPSTTGSVRPLTTGSVQPLTTGLSRSTTGSTRLTTGSPTSVRPLTTESNQPSTPATTGRVKPSTTGAVLTTSSNGGSTVPPGSVTNCTSGNMKCLSTGSYSTCNWGVWGPAQKCVTGTYCSPKGQYIYCLVGSAPETTPEVPSTSTSASDQPSTSTSSTTSSSTTTAESPAPVPIPTVPETSTTTSGSEVPSDDCALGQLRCVSTNQYQTCGHGAGNTFKWSVAQSCRAGLSCHAFGHQVYCY